MGRNRIRAKPAWLRCSFCYGTGYKVTTKTSDPKKGVLGSITNDKCFNCKGKGYTMYEPQPPSSPSPSS